MAIAAMLRNNLDIIEQTTNQMEPNSDVNILRECTALGLNYLIELTSVPEDELFKICLEFWNWFANKVMMSLRGSQFMQAQELPQVPGMDFSFAVN